MVMVVCFNMILYHSDIEGGWSYGNEDEYADDDDFDNADADDHDIADDDDNAADDEYDNASGSGG